MLYDTTNRHQPIKLLHLPLKSKRQYFDSIAGSEVFDSVLTSECKCCHRIKKQRDFRLFIFFSSSKEQGNLSGNPKVAAHPFDLLPKIPCPCRGR